MDQPRTDEQRFPLLTEEGRRLLRWMHEHPDAPRFNWPIGDRLGREALQRVRDYEKDLNSAQRDRSAGELPPWVRDFAAFCLKEVPFYRRLGGSADRFLELETIRREDLSREPWSFVPDAQPLDELIVYRTSGTTGHPLHILSHPEASAKILPLLRRALATRGVTLDGGPGRVALIQVRFRKWTGTGAMVSSFLDMAGYIKVNLNPDNWPAPDARARYLDSCNPEVYTGDPISFAELIKLPLATRTKAIISSAMMLLLFGPDQSLRIEEIPDADAWRGKIIQNTAR